MPYTKHWVKHGPFLHEYLLLYIEKLSKFSKIFGNWNVDLWSDHHLQSNQLTTEHTSTGRSLLWAFPLVFWYGKESFCLSLFITRLPFLSVICLEQLCFCVLSGGTLELEADERFCSLSQLIFKILRTKIKDTFTQIIRKHPLLELIT